MKCAVFMFRVSSTVRYHRPLYSLDAITSSISCNKWSVFHKCMAQRVKQAPWHQASGKILRFLKVWMKLLVFKATFTNGRWWKICLDSESGHWLNLMLSRPGEVGFISLRGKLAGDHPPHTCTEWTLQYVGPTVKFTPCTTGTNPINSFTSLKLAADCG